MNQAGICNLVEPQIKNLQFDETCKMAPASELKKGVSVQNKRRDWTDSGHAEGADMYAHTWQNSIGEQNKDSLSMGQFNNRARHLHHRQVNMYPIWIP